MIDGHTAALIKCDLITDLDTVLDNRNDTCHIILRLKGIDYDLKCLDVGIHLLNLRLQFVKCSLCGERKTFAVSQLDGNAVLGDDNISDERIASVTFITLVSLLTFVTLRALFACSRAYLGPVLSTICRQVPDAVPDLQLWSNGIFARITLRALWSLWTLRTLRAFRSLSAVLAILSVHSVFAVNTYSLNLLAVLIKQPFSVKSPIVDAVCVLTNTDNRSITVFSILSIGSVISICTILTVGSVIDSDLATLVKCDLITDLDTVLDNRNDTCHIILRLKGKDHGLKSLYIAVCLFTKSLKTIVQFIDFLMNFRYFISVDILT